MLHFVTNCTRNLFKSAFTVPLASHLVHTLPDLPYDYNALEPYISAEIMTLHHQKHHATYIKNLNVTEEIMSEAMAKNDVETLISNQQALRFNGGGHINHSILWSTLTPNGTEPCGDVLSYIKRDFGNFSDMKKRLALTAVGVQGSGWAWLGYCAQSDCLCITACTNQDPLKATTGLIPLFGIDVWEHAYYLQYKNVRPDYINAVFNIVNWDNVAERLKDAKLTG